MQKLCKHTVLCIVLAFLLGLTLGFIIGLTTSEEPDNVLTLENGVIDYDVPSNIITIKIPQDTLDWPIGKVVTLRVEPRENSKLTIESTGAFVLMEAGNTFLGNVTVATGATPVSLRSYGQSARCEITSLSGASSESIYTLSRSTIHPSALEID